MKDSPSDLGFELSPLETEVEVGAPEHHDGVRHDAEVITPLAQSDTLVDAENVPLFFGRVFLDDDREIVDSLDHPFRELIEHPIDDLLEFVSPQDAPAQVTVAVTFMYATWALDSAICFMRKTAVCTSRNVL